MAAIEKGKKISFDYSLTVDGEVIDSSKGKKPLEYVHGEGKLISGLTKRMEGMEAGEEREIEVPAEEGYGLPDPKAFRKTPRKDFPEEIELKPGTMLSAQKPDGSVLPVKVMEVEEDFVVIDLNHPLAGKDLFFKVKVVAVS
jgi:FKBP-type peptidyl-prolyl cis-trans isomerase 2